MFSIRSFLRVFSNDSPKVLGRWRLDYCSFALHQKVRHANEDHCGPCGQYNLKNKDKNQDNKLSKKL